MARPKGTGGKSSYDKYRRFMSTGHGRLSGQSNRFTKRRRASSWDSGWKSKFVKKRNGNGRRRSGFSR